MTTLLQIIFLILAQFSTAAEVYDCDDVFGNTVKMNINASSSVNEYAQVFGRDIAEISKIYGPAFTSRLKPGVRWLDSGSGMSLAAAQGVKNFDMEAHAINAQDYWTDIWKVTKDDLLSSAPIKSYMEDGYKIFTQGPITAMEVKDLLGQNMYTLLEVGGFKTGVFPKLGWAFKAEILEVQTARNPSEFMAHTRKWLGQVENITTALKNNKKFHPHTGFAENVLSKIEGEFDMITDTYGSFFYSATRPKLLEQDYVKLKVDGEAMICFQAGRILDTVLDKAGAKIPLLDYLTKKYPTIFTVEPGGEKNSLVLKIKKDPRIVKLDLPLAYGPDDVSYIRPFQHEPNYAIPVVQYREISN